MGGREGRRGNPPPPVHFTFPVGIRRAGDTSQRKSTAFETDRAASEQWLGGGNLGCKAGCWESMRYMGVGCGRGGVKGGAVGVEWEEQQAGRMYCVCPDQGQLR